jgi:diaminohydroxyphosphoribosylaminopyrimidine deaminase / 5-amino-6-(5-phosphoribosylamino)uracil reductase
VIDTATDSLFMKRCLQLAANGKATCSPNPMVGAVVVHQGRIIGEGWHRKAGESHAEPNAIHSVKNQHLLRESTLYVSLEPCSHYGKTPPCVELIIKKRIPRVVIGCLDPFPLVAGRGVGRLREAGVDITLGVEEAACLAINNTFFHFQKLKRPWVILKWAKTADSFLDIARDTVEEKPSLKISTPFTQMLTHKLRSECDAILVGTKTAILDNPSLNVRAWSGKNPVRAVIDRRMTLPATLNLLDGSAETLVFTEKASRKTGKTSWIHFDFDDSFPEKMMREFYDRNLQTLLVEGGTLLHDSLLKAGIWDEIHVETSPQVVHEGVLAPDTEGLVTKPFLVLESGTGGTYRKIQIFHRLERI